MTSEHAPEGLSATYDTSGPGKFEGEPPIVRYIYSVLYAEGSTPEWSGGNTGIASTVWNMAGESDR